MTEQTADWLDLPEKQARVGGLVYAFVSFFFGPFFLFVFRMAVAEDYYLLSWLEILNHVINFAVILWLFREALQYAWWTVDANKRSVLKTTAISVVLILAAAYQLLKLAPLFDPDYEWVLLENTLPITESELFMTPAFAVISNPILGTIAVVLLSPVVTACIYYAACFIPAYNVRPWLGYAAVAVLSAVLSVINGIFWWDGVFQLTLYLCRLPIHLLSCWAVQKTGTIWTPILVQAIVNLIASLAAIFLL